MAYTPKKTIPSGRYSFYLSKPLWERVDRVARYYGISRSQLVGEMLEMALPEAEEGMQQ